MTESVRFQDALFHDATHPITLEDSIRKCCVFSGVHDFDFGDDINENFADLADWTVDTSDGTNWDVSLTWLCVSGGGGGVWYQGRHDVEVEPSFIASFDYVNQSGGFVFRGKNGANDAFMAFWDGSNCGFKLIADDKSATDLVTMPYFITAPARIQVEVKWKLDSSDGDRKWLLMTLYVDGREYAAYAEDVEDSGNDWTGDEVGFAVYDSLSLEVDNFTISEISRIVEYTSIDVGDTPASGMSRAIGTTRLKYHARYDGTVKVRRPGDKSVDWAIPLHGRVNRYLNRDNRRDIPTHVRIIGALHAVDRFDDSEGDVHMHRFVLQDDPNVISESETYNEGGKFISEVKEMQAPAKLQIAGNPLIEREDRVTYNGLDFRVKSVQHVYAMRGPAPVYVTILDVQTYEGS